MHATSHGCSAPCSGVADLVQETFVEAFGSIGRLRDVDALPAWLRQIAVNRARSCIRRRARLRLFGALGFVDVPDPASKSASPEVREALAETYRIIEALPVDLRIAFTLRFVDGRELVEVAEACQVSLATIKRRLVTAEARFRRMAAHGGKLDDWLGGWP
jgi:RNA polymerase sigma-70 factor (ECF subfamily)